MRSYLLPLAVISGIAFSGVAFAGTTTTPATTATTAAATAMAPMVTEGTIKKINTKHNYVVLSDGFKYHLPQGYSMKDLKVGEKVSVTYELKGKFHNASAIKAA
jgi:hypothetical protein